MSSKLGTLTLDLVARTSNFTQDMRKAGDSVTRETKRIEDSSQSATAALSKLGALALGGFTVSSMIEAADGYTQMAARIRNATASTEEYQFVQDRVLATAQTTYRSLGEAQEVYLSLSGGMKSLGKTTNETLDLVDSLSFSFTHNATRQDQAQSAMDALSKSMAKGKIDADAWISIVTGADNVIADMAKTTGMSEAEIRKLGASGKASLEDLIKTLIATREQNEQLANNMENSLADGFTNLSTAVTVYLGQANEATSATGIMASALGVLAGNLDTVGDAAMLGGVAYLTKTMATQAVAMKQSVVSTLERRAADTALAESQVRLAALEVQRTKQVTALALTEVNLARAEYNNATTRNARALATQRLTAAEIALSIAEKQGKSAVDASTASQNALNASRAIGARMLGLVGGSIGAITLGVTALAAGYMLLKNSTDTSTESLMKNGETVDAAIKKYQDLSDVKKKSQLVDEKKTLSELSEAYERNAQAIITNAYSMTRSNETTRAQAKELNALIAEFKSTKDLDLFSKKINDLGFINQESKDKFNKLAGAVSDSSKEYKEQLRLLNGINSVSGLAVQGSKDRANAADREKAAIEGVKEAYDKYRQSAFADIKEMSARAMLQNRGLSDNQVAERLKVLKALDYKPELVSSDQGKALISLAKISADMKDKEDARAEAIKKSTQKTKADTAAKREAAKAERDLNQAIDDSRRLLYEYGNEFKRIRIDQKAGTDRILNSLLPAETKADFIRDLGEISLARQQLYAKEYEYDLDSWMWSANKKLEKEKEIEKSRILSLTGMTKDERNERIKSFEDQYKHAMVLQDLEDKGRFQSASEFFLKESEIILNRYELEREQIIATYQLNDKLRSQLLQLNKMQQIAQRDSMSDKVRQYGADANYEMYRRNDPAQYGQWQGSVAQYDMQNAYSTSMSGLDSAYSDQVAGINMLENEEQRNAELLAAHEQYLQAREALDTQYQQAEQDNQMAMHASNLSAYSSAFGSMADIVKGYAGEASGAYQALVTVQKAANLASVIMNGYTTISAAWASAPFPANIANVALATAKTGVLQAAMQAFTPNIQGMAHNGIDNIPKEGTWLLDGGERVLNPQQNKDLTNYLSNSSGGGEPVVNVYTLPGQTAEVSRNERGELVVLIKEVINQEVPAQIGDPSSRISSSISQGYGLQRNRG